MSEPTKEQIYDEQINPLMAQIINVCQQHGIAMVSSFAIPTEADADLHCTSMLPDGDGQPHPLAAAVKRHVYGGGQSLAMTITSGAAAAMAPAKESEHG